MDVFKLSSRNLYFVIIAFAIFAIFISMSTGDLNPTPHPSALHRHELFALFIYFSMIGIIYNASKSNSAELKNITLATLRVAGLSVKPIIFIYMLSTVVLLCVFLTA